MRITTTILITRPAADVWDLVGRRFAEASVWASGISESVAVGEAELPDAPCSARECHVAVPGADRLVEHLVAYDDATMSLTYTLAAGMDRVARSMIQVLKKSGRTHVYRHFLGGNDAPDRRYA